MNIIISNIITNNNNTDEGDGHSNDSDDISYNKDNNTNNNLAFSNMLQDNIDHYKERYSKNRM